MKLASFRRDTEWQTGVVIDGQVVEIGSLPDADGSEMLSFLSVSAARQQAMEDAAAEVAANGDGIELDTLRLGPPVPEPRKIICLGLNYSAHAAEARLDVPEAPMLFAKYATSLIGPGANIVLPANSQMVDYEGELAVVIGAPAKSVSEDRALEHVAGYMPFNDVSARDLQKQTSQWLAGKAIDTFAPCGPLLVTADEISDPHALEIITRVNGDVVQQDSTGLMIFSIPRIVAFVSSLMTLLPGDIIATGTPAGVGQERTPPLFLADGDVVEVEIDGVGLLSNPVVAAQDGVVASPELALAKVAG